MKGAKMARAQWEIESMKKSVEEYKTALAGIEQWGAFPSSEERLRDAIESLERAIANA
jgi:hypothetical protein